MKLEIVKRKKNSLLKREEIGFRVEESKVTPSKAEIRKKIAALNDTKENFVVVEGVRNKFGSKDFVGKANIYGNEEDMRKTELKHKIWRNFGGGKEKNETAEDKK